MSEMTIEKTHHTAASGHHDDARHKDSLKFAMWLYLASEVVLFATLIAVFVVYRIDNPERVITTDGLRVEYKDGFGLARSSNTMPVIVLRFEADNETALKRSQDDFRTVILRAKPDAVLPY